LFALALGVVASVVEIETEAAGPLSLQPPVFFFAKQEGFPSVPRRAEPA